MCINSVSLTDSKWKKQKNQSNRSGNKPVARQGGNKIQCENMCACIQLCFQVVFSKFSVICCAIQLIYVTTQCSRKCLKMLIKISKCHLIEKSFGSREFAVFFAGVSSVFIQILIESLSKMSQKIKVILDVTLLNILLMFYLCTFYKATFSDDSFRRSTVSSKEILIFRFVQAKTNKFFVENWYAGK